MVKSSTLNNLAAGTIKRIVVHGQLIKQHDPSPMRIHTKGKSIPVSSVEICGSSKVIFGEPCPQAGSARAYVETTALVRYKD